jgi:glycosyltransferase involved in cell wall biosynthesis
MQVLALTPNLHGTCPGLRFRIEQWAPHLEKAGVRVTFLPFEDEVLHRVIYQPRQYVRKGLLLLRALLRRFGVAGRARQYDVVFLYREASLIGPALVERLLAGTGVPIVYDFDDPIWLPYRSPNNGVFSLLKFTGKTASICRMAHTVTVGNSLQASWAAQHARNVRVVPSTIEMARYPARPASTAASTTTLGWTGSHSTLPFLNLLRRPLERLAQRYSFRLLVISHTDTPELGWSAGELVGKKWQAATEAVDLHEIDIGLAPFPDTGWTPWRCHGKVLQYMAAGIPTVASRIGILPEYIRDCEQGFLAATEDEWVERLSALVEDVALRRRMGARARETIGDRYSAHVWAPRVREVLEAAAAGSRRGRP